MHIEGRDTGVGMFAETVIQTTVKVVVDILLEIYRDIPVGAERAEVIDTTHMVVMAVGEQHGIHPVEILFPGLRTEVGRHIDEQLETHCPDKG